MTVNQSHGQVFALHTLCVVVLTALTACEYTTTKGKRDELLVKRAMLEIHALVTACEDYRSDHGSYPIHAEYLFTRAQNGRGTNMYLTHRLVDDPWGNKYRFLLTTNAAQVSSPGPDGRWNSKDDLLERKSMDR